MWGVLAGNVNLCVRRFKGTRILDTASFFSRSCYPGTDYFVFMLAALCWSCVLCRGSVFAIIVVEVAPGGREEHLRP